MANCYYTCNLVPLDFILDSGYTPRWLGRYLPSGSEPVATPVVHPMTCPCVTKFVAAAEKVFQRQDNKSIPASSGRSQAPGDCLVVAGGCDAMRRLGDLLAAAHPGAVFVLHLPRSSDPHARRNLARDLTRLEDWLRCRWPASVTGTRGISSEKELSASTPAVEYPSPPQPGGAFIIAGPLTDNSLLHLVEQYGVSVSALESCTSPDRWQPLSRPNLAKDHGALADFILEVGMCARRSTAERRAYLEKRLLETEASSVIYARQSFCDPGAYDALLVADIAGVHGLPFLEIEVDFPFEATGPLRTRIEAFLEAQLLNDALLEDALFDDIP